MINIKSALKNTSLFNHLSEEELHLLCEHVDIKHYLPGDLVIAEGEVGDRLYVITSGTVRVFTHDKNGQEIDLAHLNKGNYFGEQALLLMKPRKRSASIIAKTEVYALSVAHADFQKVLKANAELLNLLNEYGQEQLRDKITDQLKAYENGTHLELAHLFKRIKNYNEREIIFRQGNIAREAYYLLNGELEIRLLSSEARLKAKITINAGQFFGELNQPQQGTAVCLQNSQVGIIDVETLKLAYTKYPDLQRHVGSSMRLYQIPLLGTVTQQQSLFLGKSAFNSVIQKMNGEVLIASRLIEGEIFSITYANLKEADIEKILFEDRQDHSREISLINNHLVGVLSIGKWEDLQEATQNVQEKALLTKGDLQIFRASGLLPQSKEVNLCECMQIKSQAIEALIEDGVDTLAEISKRTGAGTVCGGCRPRIIELLSLKQHGSKR